MFFLYKFFKKINSSTCQVHEIHCLPLTFLAILPLVFFLAVIFHLCEIMISGLSLLGQWHPKQVPDQHQALSHSLRYPVLQLGEAFINKQSQICFNGHPNCCSCEGSCKAPRCDCWHWKPVHLQVSHLERHIP